VHGNIATSIFLAGWAIGGVVFGVLGDRWGRARVMMITILLYSMFTGLSSFSTGFWDFALYRFLTGLGVGGEFAVGVALVAEVMPARARPRCLALLQALSTVGNITAATISLSLGLAQEEGLVSSPWRIMFLVGAVPALLVVFIRRRLKEPERWEQVSATRDGNRRSLGSYRELFSTPQLRKHALLGLLLACSGVIGLWAVGFFVPDLMRSVQIPRMRALALDELREKAVTESQPQRVAILEAMISGSTPGDADSELLAEVTENVNQVTRGRATRWQSYTSFMLNLGGFVGMYTFGFLAERIGRKRTFVISMFGAYLSTVAVFALLEEFWHMFVLVPLMGVFQFSLFAGYAIYFPELFPTRLRSTGTSFCYNVGRLVAAIGPLIQAALIQNLASNNSSLRTAGLVMSTVLLTGLIALPFLPETKDKPLPE
jgi:MFS family permease